jgi:hypothetical protein
MARASVPRREAMTDLETTAPDAPVNDTPADDQDGVTPEWITANPTDAYKALRATREEAKQHRLRAKELADALDATRKAAEREKLDEVSRLKADLEEWQGKYTSLEHSLRTERIKAQLAPHVENVDDAIKVLTDDYVSKDGTVDVERFKTDKPYMAKRSQPASVKNLNAGAQPATSMNDLIRRAAGR